jgi:hypothetical protein
MPNSEDAFIAPKRRVANILRSSIRTGSKIMVEKRAVHRSRVLKSGTISFGGGSIDCTVRNLSPSGASLQVASPVGVPPSFTLIIETDHFIRRCHSVWRNATRIGVAFD